MISMGVAQFQWVLITTAAAAMVFGGFSVHLFYDTRRKMLESKHIGQIAEQSNEIIRLRAQVAMLIGKDHT
jgi:hypothetical protein